MSSSSICAENPLVQVLVQRGHTCCASLAVRYLIDMVLYKGNSTVRFDFNDAIMSQFSHRGEHVRFYKTCASIILL